MHEKPLGIYILKNCRINFQWKFTHEKAHTFQQREKEILGEGAFWKRGKHSIGTSFHTIHCWELHQFHILLVGKSTIIVRKRRQTEGVLLVSIVLNLSIDIAHRLANNLNGESQKNSNFFEGKWLWICFLTFVLLIKKRFNFSTIH